MLDYTAIVSATLFLTATAFSLWISKKHIFRAIMAACIYEMAFILLSSLIYAVLSLAIADLDLLMQGTAGVGRYIYILLHKTALFTVLQLVLHIFRSDEAMNVWNGILAFLLSLTTMLGLGATMYVAVSLEVDDFHPQILVVVISFVLINVFLYILLY